MDASTPDRILPALLLALTATTGFVDAVSYLALGHVFTANMTGNVVFLGFAVAKVPELSIARSGAALGAFVIGAALGGRLAARIRCGGSPAPPSASIRPISVRRPAPAR